VLGDLLDLLHPLDVEAGLLLDLSHRSGRDLAELGPGSQTASSTCSHAAIRASSVQIAAISGVE